MVPVSPWASTWEMGCDAGERVDYFSHPAAAIPPKRQKSRGLSETYRFSAPPRNRSGGVPTGQRIWSPNFHIVPCCVIKRQNPLHVGVLLSARKLFSTTLFLLKQTSGGFRANIYIYIYIVGGVVWYHYPPSA